MCHAYTRATFPSATSAPNKHRKRLESLTAHCTHVRLCELPQAQLVIYYLLITRITHMVTKPYKVLTCLYFFPHENLILVDSILFNVHVSVFIFDILFCILIIQYLILLLDLFALILRELKFIAWVVLFSTHWIFNV